MKTSKILATLLALALLMVTALPMSVRAAVGDTEGLEGSITITPPDSGLLSLTADNFAAYKLFDLVAIRGIGNLDPTGDPPVITGFDPYTPYNPDSDSESIDPATSAHFVYEPATWLQAFLTEVNSPTYTTNPELFRKWLQAQAYDTDAMVALAKAIAKYEHEATGTEAAALATAKAGDAIQTGVNIAFNDLSYGYYLVVGYGDRTDYGTPTDPSAPKGRVITRGMLVNVPEEVIEDDLVTELDPNPDRVLKADAPTLDKLVLDDEKNDRYNSSVEEPWDEDAEKEIGELYSYKITVKIPDDYSMKGFDLDKYIFRIYDELEPGITLAKDQGSAAFDPTNPEGDDYPLADITVTRIRGDQSDVLTPGDETENYTLTYEKWNNADPPARVPDAPLPNANVHEKFTVQINSSAFAAGTVQAGDEILIEYKARLNQFAKIGPTNPNENDAWLEYSNNPNWDDDSTGETPHDKTRVYTYAFQIKKVDGEDNVTTLAGAKFTLSRHDPSDGGKPLATSSTELPYNPMKFILTDGKYRVLDATQTVGQTIIATPTNGVLTFEGLDEGIYWLTETEAPTGYNLLEDPIKIMISSAGVVTFIDNDEDLEDRSNLGVLTGGQYILVQNHTGGILPGTGGIGRTIFYAASAVITLGLAAFVAYLVIRRRKKLLGAPSNV